MPTQEQTTLTQEDGAKAERAAAARLQLFNGELCRHFRCLDLPSRGGAAEVE